MNKGQFSSYNKLEKALYPKELSSLQLLRDIINHAEIIVMRKGYKLLRGNIP